MKEEIATRKQKRIQAAVIKTKKETKNLGMEEPDINSELYKKIKIAEVRGEHKKAATIRIIIKAFASAKKYKTENNEKCMHEHLCIAKKSAEKIGIPIKKEISIFFI